MNKKQCPAIDSVDIGDNATFYRTRRGFRCFGCRKFWIRCFRRFGRGLRRRFRGGR